MSENIEHVFVYGTLKKGHGNHVVLQEGRKSEFVGPALTVGQYGLRNAGFPYLYRYDEVMGQVSGEVYKITHQSVLEGLDLLEGTAYNHYTREIIDVEVEGEILRCYTYVAGHEAAESNRPVCDWEEGVLTWE